MDARRDAKGMTFLWSLFLMGAVPFLVVAVVVVVLGVFSWSRTVGAEESWLVGCGEGELGPWGSVGVVVVVQVEDFASSFLSEETTASSSEATTALGGGGGGGGRISSLVERVCLMEDAWDSKDVNCNLQFDDDDADSSFVGSGDVVCNASE